MHQNRHTSGRLVLLSSMLVLALIATGCATGSVRSPAPQSLGTESAATAKTAAWFEAHRERPPQLRNFLQRMPKGGDLHIHLSGSVYAESYLAWAAAGDYCIVRHGEDPAIRQCSALREGDTDVVAAAEALKDPQLYDRLVDLLSTRNLAFAGRSGHDQFFSTFAQFNPLVHPRLRGAMIADVASRAAAENTSYLELMLNVGSSKSRLPHVALSEDFAATREKLLDAGIRELAADWQTLDQIEADTQRLMKCGLPDQDPGCTVTLRYQQQVIRSLSPASVFAQMVYAFERAKSDPRVVGLNLVAPEDNPVALRDYTLHMQMLDFLATQTPEVNVALHAGELTLGLVPPEALRFHIREAVELGHARRLGHATDIAYEDDAPELLTQLRERDILVEICLTSSDVILGVRGAEHPFQTYREAGVPVALGSDDAGVARSDFSHEFLRAALTYDLGYLDLKELARNSLRYSFLPGESLWRRDDLTARVEVCVGATPDSAPLPACADFLAGSQRASEQWRLEERFAAFESLGWEP
jgi:hypothetical protein